VTVQTRDSSTLPGRPLEEATTTDFPPGPGGDEAGGDSDKKINFINFFYYFMNMYILELSFTPLPISFHECVYIGTFLCKVESKALLPISIILFLCKVDNFALLPIYN
jgi:hypothetical protein